MEATIKLFRALPIQNKKKKDAERSLLEATIPRGFIFSPEVVANYPEQELLKIAKDIGRTPAQLNNSFHKSWKKVRNAHITQLVLEQILHYFTTYGFEALGVYNEDSVYIPNEQLDIPELTISPKLDSIKLVVIKGYTKEELKEKALKMLSSGIALKEDTFNYIIEICVFAGISPKEVKEVKNKEARIKLYDYLDILPEDPLEFLRFVLYRTINETLLIKSGEIIEKITSADKLPAFFLLQKYKEQYGLKNLAGIFNRFKPLFLALKSGQCVLIINKISKLSKKHHKPMKKDYLNEVTSMIKRGEPISVTELSRELRRVNTFRKIRLAYALKYRTKDVSSILYKIRNGKSWAEEISYDSHVKAKSDEILKVVLGSIVYDINKHVANKKIYLPKSVEYALPATEKQFTGNLPSGTYLTIDQDSMVFGVHWFNHEGRRGESSRVDLDLSLITVGGMKYGWDGEYRSSGKNILFSGDVTNAPRPKGASELFYLYGSLKSPGILMVNYFNYSPQEVPFEIIVAKHQPRTLSKNYVIDPNDIVCSIESKIDSPQKILGIVTTSKDLRFYFSESLIGMSITSRASRMIENAMQYLTDFYTDTISLNEILLLSDAEIVEDEEECDINLSLEKIERDSILNLLS